jgi:hypothetical protein
MAIISKHYRFILFETITKFSLFQKKVYGLVPTAEHKTLLDSLPGQNSALGPYQYNHSQE